MFILKIKNVRLYLEKNIILKGEKVKKNNHHLPVPQSANSLVQTKILYRVKSAFPFIYIRATSLRTLRFRTGRGSVREGNILCFSFQRAQQVPPPFGGLSKIRNSYIASRKKKYYIINIIYITYFYKYV